MKHLLSSIILAFGSLTDLSAVEEPRTEIKLEKGTSVVIIGGGIGALTSALYLGRAGLEPIVIEGATPGGLLTQSHSVQNWPGELEIEGFELTDKVRKQVEANGAQFRQEEVIAVDFSKRPFTITTRALDNPDKINTIQAEACIIAMGTQPNFLNIPGETGPNGYWGRGVTNCAICDGSLYKDQIVGVVGGGDAAVLEALYLSNIAKEVHVFVRIDTLRAFEEKRIETLLDKSNVTMHYNTVVREVVGDEKKVTHVMLQNG
ncbi:MAG TPA: FAD-dependent oxidoreductase, partial [Chlamydiales bacterium]|nr:FAD-dependent oxidoreductase [Chlamydiales bacterium]